MLGADQIQVALVSNYAKQDAINQLNSIGEMSLNQKKNMPIKQKLAIGCLGLKNEELATT